MSDKRPAIVIVDSRNLLHQIEDVTGSLTHATVDGVVSALDVYGFDVQQVHVGLARARAQDREVLARQDQENEALQDAVEQHEKGRVLLGELHAKGDGVVNEKMVDVACAVDVCRQIADSSSEPAVLIVCSADTDLSPAYQYAKELQYPLYVAAAGDVNRRSDPHLILPPAALERASGQPVGASWALRARIAAAVMTGGAHDFEVVRWDRARDGVLLRRVSDGLPGIASSVDMDHVGPDAVHEIRHQTVTLRVVGVDLGSRQKRFPILRCALRGGGGASLVRGVVRGFPRAGAVRVELKSGVQVSCDCPPGMATQGSTVRVLAGGSTSTVIDVVQPAPLTAGGVTLNPASPMIVTVKMLAGPSSGLPQAVSEAGHRYGLLVDQVDGAARSLRLGGRYAALPCSTSGTGRLKFLAQVISAELPELQTP